MKLQLVRHLWGVTDPMEVCFPRFRDQGYEIIETGIKPEGEERDQLMNLLDKYGFGYIPQAFTGGKSVDEHLAKFKAQLIDAKECGALFVNVHSGHDNWTDEEGLEFFRVASELEKEIGIVVAHETHRGRFLFHPRMAKLILDACPDIKLCADFSHWVNVCEAILTEEKFPGIIQMCAERTLHIHARVGYEEGPQVPDPSAPEYAYHLEAHEAWWDIVWASQKARGFEVSTLCPEFGPRYYLHTIPHTNVPVADLETVCNWQANRQRERYYANA